MNVSSKNEKTIRLIVFIPAAILAVYIFRKCIDYLIPFIVRLFVGQDVDDKTVLIGLSFLFGSIIKGAGAGLVLFYTGKAMAPKNDYIPMIILVIILWIICMAQTILMWYIIQEVGYSKTLNKQFIIDISLILSSVYCTYRTTIEYSYLKISRVK